MRARSGGRWASAVVRLAGVLMAGALVMAAQDAGAPDELQALRHGSLVVWVVGPVQQKVTIISNYAITQPVPMGYTEQTAGSFGQSASSYGQNAGSVGIPTDSARIGTQKSVGSDDAPAGPAPDGSSYKEQTAGSFGTAASSVGVAASDHGQTAGSFGTAASNSGTNAGNYGQTAGNFGGGLNTIAQQPAAPAQPPSELRSLVAGLLGKFPGLQAKYVDVASNELRDRLRAADGSGEYPDVLVGTLPNTWDMATRKQMVLAMVLPAREIYDGLAPVSYRRSTMPEVAILIRARHMREAQAFALLLSEHESECAGCVATKLSVNEAAAATVANSAVGRMVRGEGLGDVADPEMAALPVQLTRVMLTTTDNGQADGAAARVETMQALLNGKVAAVAERVVVSSDRVFGVVHPLVVLRQNDAGVWRVLHVSVNLPAFEQQRAMHALMVTSPTAVAEKAAGVMGVKLAEPAEGEARQPAPELSWDNGGGAGLQVIEWQRAAMQGWWDARLMLVADRAPTLQTQVTGTFADRDGGYRWRVWSVGAAGAMKISPWRTMMIER